MTHDELAHVLRASAAISNETSFVLVGSQAVLLLLEQPPADLLVSTEIDLYPALHPEKADLIDGAIGAMTIFDTTYGYHADGVGPETAVMPSDWHSRETFHYIGDVTVICPELHDLAVSKCVAGREKDADFIRCLLKHQMIDPQLLIDRIQTLDAHQYPVTTLVEWVKRRRLVVTSFQEKST